MGVRMPNPLRGLVKLYPIQTPPPTFKGSGLCGLPYVPTYPMLGVLQTDRPVIPSFAGPYHQINDGCDQMKVCSLRQRFSEQAVRHLFRIMEMRNARKPRFAYKSRSGPYIIS